MANQDSEQRSPRLFHEDSRDFIAVHIAADTAPWMTSTPADQMPPPPCGLNGQAFHGINAVKLMTLMRQYRLSDPRFLTEAEGVALGGTLSRPNAPDAGCEVAVWQYQKTEPLVDANGETLRDAAGNPRVTVTPLVQPRFITTRVYHVSQFEGLDLEPYTRPALTERERHERVELLLQGSRANIFRNADATGLTPSGDVRLESPERFGSTDAYYSAAVTQISRWTARQAISPVSERDQTPPLGSVQEAHDSLRDAITTYRLCSELGIGYDGALAQQHKALWQQALDASPNALGQIAAEAEKSVEYLLGREMLQKTQGAATPFPPKVVLSTTLGEGLGVRGNATAFRDWNAVEAAYQQLAQQYPDGGWDNADRHEGNMEAELVRVDLDSGIYRCRMPSTDRDGAPVYAYYSAEPFLGDSPMLMRYAGTSREASPPFERSNVATDTAHFLAALRRDRFAADRNGVVYKTVGDGDELHLESIDRHGNWHVMTSAVEGRGGLSTREAERAALALATLDDSPPTPPNTPIVKRRVNQAAYRLGEALSLVNEVGSTPFEPDVGELINTVALEPNQQLASRIAEHTLSHKRVDLLIVIFNQVGGRFPERIDVEHIRDIGLGYAAMTRKHQRGYASQNGDEQEAFLRLDNPQTIHEPYFGTPLRDDLERIDRFKRDLAEISLAVDGKNLPYHVSRASANVHEMQGYFIVRGGGAYFNEGYSATVFGSRDSELSLEDAINIAAENAHFPEREDLWASQSYGFADITEENRHWRNFKPSNKQEAFQKNLHTVGVGFDDRNTSFKVYLPLADANRYVLEVEPDKGFGQHERLYVGFGQAYGWSMDQARRAAFALADFGDKAIDERDFRDMFSRTGGVARDENGRFYEVIAPEANYGTADSKGFTVGVFEQGAWRYFGGDDKHPWSRQEAIDKAVELMGVEIAAEHRAETEPEPPAPSFRVPTREQMTAFHYVFDTMFDKGELTSDMGRRLYKRVFTPSGDAERDAYNPRYALQQFDVNIERDVMTLVETTPDLSASGCADLVCAREGLDFTAKEMFLHYLDQDGYFGFGKFHYRILDNDLTGEGSALAITTPGSFELRRYPERGQAWSRADAVQQAGQFDERPPEFDYGTDRPYSPTAEFKRGLDKLTELLKGYTTEQTAAYERFKNELRRPETSPLSPNLGGAADGRGVTFEVVPVVKKDLLNGYGVRITEPSGDSRLLTCSASVGWSRHDAGTVAAFHAVFEQGDLLQLEHQTAAEQFTDWLNEYYQVKTGIALGSRLGAEARLTGEQYLDLAAAAQEAPELLYANYEQAAKCLGKPLVERDTLIQDLIDRPMTFDHAEYKHPVVTPISEGESLSSETSNILPDDNPLHPSYDSLSSAQQEFIDALIEGANTHAQPGSARIAVPYAEKDGAAAAGALWNTRDKTWTAGQDADHELLESYAASADSPTIPVLTPKEELGEQMRRGGLVAADTPIIDGQPHDTAVVDGKPDGREGQYQASADARGITSTYVRNNKTGQAEQGVVSGHTVTPEGRKELERDAAAARTVGQERAEAEQARAARRAYAKWMNGQPVSSHPALAERGVAAYGLRQDKSGNLMIPGYDLKTGRVATVVYVNNQGKRWSERQCVKEKAALVLPNADALAKGKSKTVLVAEGYESAASLHQATGLPVVAAFSVKSMTYSAQVVRDKLPKAEIVICPNLASNHIIQAAGAAAAVQGSVMAPKFTKEERAQGLSTFNDLHRSIGTDGLKTFVEQERQAARERGGQSGAER